MESRESFRVLIVEDEPVMASVLKTFFQRRFSGQPMVAEDYARAKEKLESGTFDIVTLDYQLPDDNGFKLLEEIRAMDSPPPVVVVTGHGNEQIAASALKLGASGYVVKDKRLSTMLPVAVEHVLSELSLRRAEEALRESEEHYRSLFNDSPVSIWEEDLSEVKSRIDSLRESGVSDLDEFLTNNRDVLVEFAALVKVLDVNEATMKMYGAEDKREFLYDLGRIFSEESYEAVREGIVTLAEGNTSFQSEAINLSLAGDILHVLMRWSIPNGHKDDWSKVIISIIDITERKLMEEELLESERRYKTIADFACDWEEWVGPDGNYLYVSPACKRITGYSPEAFIETPGLFLRLVHPDDREFVVRQQRQAQETRRARAYDFRIIDRGGQERWIGHRGQPVIDANGDCVGWRCSLRDITEQKVAEEKHKRVISTAADGFWFIDEEGNILDVNEACCRQTGYTRDEILNMKVPDIEMAEGAESVVAQLEQAKAEGSACFETRYRRKDGGVIDVEVSLGHLRFYGDRFFSFTRDITNRKRAEKKMQRINVELEGYDHTVSHDLKGPISGIMMAASLVDRLLEGVGNIDVEGVSELVEIIEKCAVDANRRIEDLLALAEAGQVPREISDFDVSELVETVIDERSIEIIERGMDVLVDPDLGHIRADPVQIRQVFSNLVSNAIKHNDSEKPVLWISCLGDDDDGRHRYLVRDNGPGIPQEILDKVFVAFVKGKSGDTGVGLSIVEKILSMYEGEIRAYNEDGACFEFTLKDFQE